MSQQLVGSMPWYPFCHGDMTYVGQPQFSLFLHNQHLPLIALDVSRVPFPGMPFDASTRLCCAVLGFR